MQQDRERRFGKQCGKLICMNTTNGKCLPGGCDYRKSFSKRRELWRGEVVHVGSLAIIGSLENERIQIR